MKALVVHVGAKVVGQLIHPPPQLRDIVLEARDIRLERRDAAIVIGQLSLDRIEQPSSSQSWTRCVQPPAVAATKAVTTATDQHLVLTIRPLLLGSQGGTTSGRFPLVFCRHGSTLVVTMIFNIQPG